MTDKQTTRRRFLLATITFSGVASSSMGISLLRSSVAWAAAEDDFEDLTAMGRFAQLLFPHEGLSNTVYGEVISDVLAATAADAATQGLLSTAAESLNAAQGGNWMELDEPAQLDVMANLQDEPFFADIREMVRFRLYHHPGMWKHIGYPGSSKEHGGYKFRGFDDIDWLSEKS